MTFISDRNVTRKYCNQPGLAKPLPRLCSCSFSQRGDEAAGLNSKKRMSWQTTKTRRDGEDTTRLGKVSDKSSPVRQFWHSTTLVSNLSTPARESGKQLPAYKTSKRGNPRAQPSYYHWSNTAPRAIPPLSKSLYTRETTTRRATTNPQTRVTCLFAAHECVQKISCHLSTVGVRHLSVGTDSATSSGATFQSKPL